MSRSETSKTFLLPITDHPDLPSIVGWPTVGVNGLLAALQETDYEQDLIQETERVVEAILTSLTNLLMHGGGITSTGGNIFAENFADLQLNNAGKTALLHNTVIQGQINILQRKYGFNPDLFGLENPLKHVYFIAPEADSKIVRIDTRGGSVNFSILNYTGSRSVDLSTLLIDPFHEYANTEFANRQVFPLIGPRSLVRAFFYDIATPAEL